MAVKCHQLILSASDIWKSCYVDTIDVNNSTIGILFCCSSHQLHSSLPPLLRVSVMGYTHQNVNVLAISFWQNRICRSQCLFQHLKCQLSLVVKLTKVFDGNESERREETYLQGIRSIPSMMGIIGRNGVQKQKSAHQTNGMAFGPKNLVISSSLLDACLLFVSRRYEFDRFHSELNMATKIHVESYECIATVCEIGSCVGALHVCASYHVSTWKEWKD